NHSCLNQLINTRHTVPTGHNTYVCWRLIAELAGLDCGVFTFPENDTGHYWQSSFKSRLLVLGRNVRVRQRGNAVTHDRITVFVSADENIGHTVNESVKDIAKEASASVPTRVVY